MIFSPLASLPVTIRSISASALVEQARDAGRAFTEEGLALFCRRVGSNLQDVHGELVKLFAYLGERPLADVEDVTAIVSDSRVDSIFDLTNALGQGNPGEALRLLGRILEEGVAPLLVLAMGLCVGFVVVAVLLPIFQLNQLVK